MIEREHSAIAQDANNEPIQASQCALFFFLCRKEMSDRFDAALFFSLQNCSIRDRNVAITSKWPRRTFRFASLNCRVFLFVCFSVAFEWSLRRFSFLFSFVFFFYFVSTWIKMIVKSFDFDFKFRSHVLWSCWDAIDRADASSACALHPANERDDRFVDSHSAYTVISKSYVVLLLFVVHMTCFTCPTCLSAIHQWQQCSRIEDDSLLLVNDDWQTGGV